jgi:hypothetical protein
MRKSWQAPYQNMMQAGRSLQSGPLTSCRADPGANLADFRIKGFQFSTLNRSGFSERPAVDSSLILQSVLPAEAFLINSLDEPEPLVKL